jgi:hypothetical protein
MRMLLGVTRDMKILANVAETTIVGQWVGRHDARLRAQLVDSILRLELPDGQVLLLDPDRGMQEGPDA